VLVYEEATDAAEDKNKDFERNEKWRQQFMANLRKAGMQHEEVVIIQVFIYRPEFTTVGLHVMESIMFKCSKMINVTFKCSISDWRMHAL